MAGEENPVVKVEPIPDQPGARLLHFADGKPPIVALEEVARPHEERLAHEAESPVIRGIKNFLQPPIAGDSPMAERRRQWQRERLGDEAPPAVVSISDQVSNAPPPAEPPPAAAPAPASEGAAPPPAAGSPPAPAPAAAPLTTDQLAAQAEDAERRAAIGRLQNGVWDPGSAGRKAGFTPSAQRTTTEHGPAYDEAAEAKRQELGAAVLAAQQAKAESDKATFDEAAKSAALRNLEATQDAARIRAGMLEKEANHQRQEASMQKDLADYSEAEKPDPRKYWSTPGGAFSGMLSAIAQGLGAFAAIRSGTENFALKIAQEKMRMEMAAQEKAYDNGRGDRKNALARMVEHYNGDMDLARLGLREALAKTAQTETERFAAQSRSKDVMNQAKILTAQFAQDGMEAQQARKDLAAGKVTTTQDERYQQAVAARAPGYHAQTQAQRDADLKRAGPKKATDSNFEANRLKYGEKKEAEAPARAGLAKIAGAIGAVWDQETGKWVMPKGKEVSIPGHGSGSWKPNALTAQRGVDFRNDMAGVVLDTGKMISGTDVPESTLKHIEGMSGSSGSDADVLPGLNRLQEKIDSAARERDATYGTDVVEAHEASKREVVARNKAKPANARETPVK